MSINKITYLDLFYPNSFAIFSNPSISIIDSFALTDYKHFLKSLDSDKIYVVSFEFFTSWFLYDEDSPLVTLSKPILVTKNSNPILISNFIEKHISSVLSNYNLDDSILNKIGEHDGPGVIIKYSPINLFSVEKIYFFCIITPFSNIILNSINNVLKMKNYTNSISYVG